MRLGTGSVAVLAGALLAAGCSGSEPAATVPDAELGAEDLAPLVAVEPTATGWRSAEWTASPETPGPRTRADLDEGLGLDPSDPSFETQSTLSAAYQDAGFVESRQGGWQDEASLARSTATLFETGAGARDALAAARDFAEGWYTEIERRQIRDVTEADGLGEDSWAVRGGTNDVGFVELAWTRGNALLGVYLSCSPCTSDVAVAARRWADAIDAAAVAASEGGTPGSG